MRKRFLLLLLAAVMLSALTACRSTPESGGQTTTPVVTVSPNEEPDPLDDIHQEKTVQSTQLWCHANKLVFVAPHDNRLTRVELSTGRTTAICDLPAYREFLVIEDRIFFRNLDTGELCAVNENGTELRRYFKMPFCRGAMKDSVLYFLNSDGADGGDAVLYTYNPLDGIWATAILSGCTLSPNRQTTVFIGDALFYLANDTGVDRLIRQTLETGERTVIYTASQAGSGRLTNLYAANNTLYFHDRSNGETYRYADGAPPRSVTVAGDRIYAVLTEGILFGTVEAGGDRLFFGNTLGDYTEYRHGIVMAAGGPRALVRRTSGGLDVLAMVKYPEDEAQTLFTGLISHVAADNAGHAVVFFYDTTAYTYVNLSAGKTEEFSMPAVELERLPAADYIAAGEKPHTVLAETDLTAIAPQQFVQLFATAAAKNDRYTLAMLSGDIGSYPPIRIKSWTISRSEQSSDEARVTYRINYALYTPADAWCMEYAPEIIRTGSLTFVQQEDGWHLLSR